MKKRIQILALLCLSVVMIGCQSKENKKTEDAKQKASQKTEETVKQEEETSPKEAEQAGADITEKVAGVEISDKTVEELGLDKFITLGDYKGIKLTKTIGKVTDEEVEAEIKTKLSETAKEVKKGELVKKGDITNIDYEGKIDGVAFDGGTAQGTDLTIGSGQFIPGFEDGVIGMKVGDSKDIKVTFPKDYGSADLAGKEAVFTVKLNAIKRAESKVSDQWVKENTEYKSVKEYKENIKKEREAANQETAQASLESSAWQKVVEGSTPLLFQRADIDEGVATYRKQYETYASYMGQDLATYLASMGSSEEALNKEAETYGRNLAYQKLVLRAIVEKEGFGTEDEDYKAALDEVIKMAGVENYEALLQMASETEIQQTVQLRRVLAFIVKNAEVKENK